jgi:hypothetical protein
MLDPTTITILLTSDQLDFGSANSASSALAQKLLVSDHALLRYRDGQIS